MLPKKTIELLKNSHYEMAVNSEMGYSYLNPGNRFEFNRLGSSMSKENLALIISGAALITRRI